MNLAEQQNYYPHLRTELDSKQKIHLGLCSLGFLFLFIAAIGPGASLPLTFLIFSIGFISTGSLCYISHTEKKHSAGVSNHNVMFSSFKTKGLSAWIIAVLLTGFYTILYWWPHLFEKLYRMLDPLSLLIRGEPTQWWFFYGTFYTLAILLTGVRSIIKYRHNKYQINRTLVVMAAQFFLSWLIPALLVLFRQPEVYMNYSWPLSYSDLWPNKFMSHWESGASMLAPYLAIYLAAFSFIITPILTYYYGKRWYCSWVCGCGGLANTLGDPFRHLSSKSKKSWDIEKITIHSILVLIIIITAILWYAYSTNLENSFTTSLAKFYGFMIGQVFAGVIGVGLYPLFGTRVWCRFGCPQAAILGILQKYFSRFRITTNGSQCISCGNCSTYCEMGIDVRSYAQKGENIIRASCVGCGICSNVCPRGVLNLENGPSEGRYNPSISLVDEIKSQ